MRSPSGRRHEADALLIAAPDPLFVSQRSAMPAASYRIPIDEIARNASFLQAVEQSVDARPSSVISSRCVLVKRSAMSSGDCRARSTNPTRRIGRTRRCERNRKIGHRQRCDGDGDHLLLSCRADRCCETTVASSRSLARMATKRLSSSVQRRGRKAYVRVRHRWRRCCASGRPAARQRRCRDVMETGADAAVVGDRLHVIDFVVGQRAQRLPSASCASKKAAARAPAS